MIRAVVLALLALGLAAHVAQAAGPDSTLLQSRWTGLDPLPRPLMNESTLAQTGNDVVSADGCRTVFTSASDGLVATDDDARAGLYVRDSCADTIALAGRVGTEQLGRVANGAISANGRYVAFFGATSPTANPGTLYRHDLETGETVAFAAAGLRSDHPLGVTDDGRIAVQTPTTYSDADQNTALDVYLVEADGGAALVSRKADGTAAGGQLSGISGDGNVVLFSTFAQAAPGDDNTGGDVYVRDVGAGTTTLMSRRNGASGAAVGSVGGADLSADGLSVAFTTTEQLVAADTNNSYDVYRRQDDQTLLVSVVEGSTQAGGGAFFQPSISGDGGLVTFITGNPGMTPAADANGAYDVFLRDVDAAQTTLVTGVANQTVRRGGFKPALAASGNALVFETDTPELTIPNDFRRVVRKRLTDGGYDLVSSPPSGQPFHDQVNESSSPASRDAVSDTGRHTVFLSRSDVLSTQDADFVTNVFVRDNREQTTTLVNRAVDGAADQAGATDAVISGDGRRVAFVTEGRLDPELDEDAEPDVYVRDLVAGTTVLASRGEGDESANVEPTGELAISGDGTRVAFVTLAKLLAADGNASFDVYVRDLGTQTTLLATHDGDEALGGRAPALDGDGSHVAYEGRAQADGEWGIARRDLATGTGVLVSRADGAEGEAANGFSTAPSISADGERVAFTSDAGNLSENAVTPAVYVRDVARGTTVLASRADGADGAGVVGASPSISAWGARVAFVGQDEQVWVRDLAQGKTLVANRAHGAEGAVADRTSSSPSISGSGRCVLFTTRSGGMTADHETGDFAQVYLRSLDGDCPDEDAPQPAVEVSVDETTAVATIVVEEGARLRCALDDEQLVACASPYERTGLADGTHTVRVEATDEAGNRAVVTKAAKVGEDEPGGEDPGGEDPEGDDPKGEDKPRPGGGETPAPPAPGPAPAPPASESQGPAPRAVAPQPARAKVLKARVRGGRVLLTISCAAKTACRGSVTVRAKGRGVVARGRYSVAAGKRTTVTLRLAAKARRAKGLRVSARLG